MESKNQSQHVEINRREYPGTRQLCCKCDEPTGRCEDDELFFDGIGPLCIECYEVVFITPELVPEPPTTAIDCNDAAFQFANEFWKRKNKLGLVGVAEINHLAACLRERDEKRTASSANLAAEIAEAAYQAFGGDSPRANFGPHFQSCMVKVLTTAGVGEDKAAVKEQE